MRILGIDPGYDKTGYAVLIVDGDRTDQIRRLESGTIRTDATESLSLRLLSVRDQLKEIAIRAKPDCLAIESIFIGKNKKTAINVAHSRGVVLLMAAELGIDVVEFTPLHVKKSIVGHGTATKDQVKYMVEKLLLNDQGSWRVPDDESPNREGLSDRDYLLKADEDRYSQSPESRARRSDDEYDAIAVALCAIYSH